MRQSIKLLVPFLILATAVSCSDLFNGGDNDDPKLTMNTLVFEPIEIPDRDTLYQKNREDLPDFTSNVSNGQIVINGYFMAGGGGYKPAGSIDQVKNTLMVFVQRPEDYNGAIASAPRGWLYNAHITNLSPSRYTVKIIHKGDFFRGYEGKDHNVFSKEFIIE